MKVEISGKRFGRFLIAWYTVHVPESAMSADHVAEPQEWCTWNQSMFSTFDLPLSHTRRDNDNDTAS
jgi:hypothetical protein